MRKTFLVEPSPQGWRNIDREVGEAVTESAVENGICLLSLPHTTAGLAVTSSWDPKGIQDGLGDLRARIPARISYLHPCSPFASAARTRAAVTGCGHCFIVREGKLLLGHSQSLVLLDFDGPQEREVTVTVLERPFYFEAFAFSTAFGEMRDVTAQAEAVVARSGVRDGFCHLSVVAVTAGLMLCAAGQTKADLWQDLERMIPTRGDFLHRETASDAGGHTKTFVAGTQLDLPVTGGKLLLGREQRIVYAEFDGPRPRDVKAAVYEG